MNLGLEDKSVIITGATIETPSAAAGGIGGDEAAAGGRGRQGCPG